MPPGNDVMSSKVEIWPVWPQGKLFQNSGIWILIDLGEFAAKGIHPKQYKTLNLDIKDARQARNRP